MGVNISVNINGLRAKVSPQNIQRGRYAMANQMGADMIPFVPKKNNDLRDSMRVSPDGMKVIFDTPYAKAQYNGQAGHRVFRKYSTTGTGKHWDKRAKALYRRSWERAFIEGAKLNGN